MGMFMILMLIMMLIAVDDTLDIHKYLKKKHDI